MKGELTQSASSKFVCKYVCKFVHKLFENLIVNCFINLFVNLVLIGLNLLRTISKLSVSIIVCSYLPLVALWVVSEFRTLKVHWLSLVTISYHWLPLTIIHLVADNSH